MINYDTKEMQYIAIIYISMRVNATADEISSFLCAWFVVFAFLSINKSIKKIKMNIFPVVEFRIGQNENIYKANEKKRYLIIISILLPIIINFICSFLF